MMTMMMTWLLPLRGNTGRRYEKTPSRPRHSSVEHLPHLMMMMMTMVMCNDFVCTCFFLISSGVASYGELGHAPPRLPNLTANYPSIV